MDWTPLWLALGAGFGRGIAGWAKNAFADGKVEFPEWKQLGTTVVRVGVLTVGSYFVIDWMNPENAELAAVGAGMLLDVAIRAWQSQTASPAAMKKK